MGQYMTDYHVLHNKTAAFIGGGNMAGAMIDGLLTAKRCHNLSLSIGVSDKNADKRDRFASQGVLTATPDTAHQLMTQADMVVLAVKPQVLMEVAPSLAPHLADKLVLSVLAGVPCATLQRVLGCGRVVRAMPNLPSALGAGATGLYADQGVSSLDKDMCEMVMTSCGVAVWVDDETKLHAVTAVAGSAPAYFFYVLEHMIAQAMTMGLTADDAHRLAVQSMVGAGLLAKDANPQALRMSVMSKGGTTAQAISSLERDDVGGAFGRAMMACYDRSIELGELFDDK